MVKPSDPKHNYPGKKTKGRERKVSGEPKRFWVPQRVSQKQKKWRERTYGLGLERRKCLRRLGFHYEENRDRGRDQSKRCLFYRGAFQKEWTCKGPERRMKALEGAARLA